MLVQLEFLGLTTLYNVEEGKEILQIYWDSPYIDEKYNEFLNKTKALPIYQTAKLCEFKDSNRVANLGYIKVPIWSLYRVY